MKILTDFDGVLTDLTEESCRVRELFDTYLFELGGEETARECMAVSQEKMRQSPHLHGWRSNGRVTAFSNEDGFIFVNGLAATLDDEAAAGQPLFLSLLGNLRKVGVDRFSILANRAYAQMTRETEAGLLKPMDEGAGRVLNRLLEMGHSIVVVSNSGTGRIQRILSEAGVSAAVRIRGDARKYELGDRSDALQCEPFVIPLDRPSYRAILLEENPDVVIGDVFSLDLALPTVLLGNRLGNRAKVFLRWRDYTPQWSLDCMARILKEAPGGILERFDDLLTLGSEGP